MRIYEAFCTDGNIAYCHELFQFSRQIHNEQHATGTTDSIFIFYLFLPVFSARREFKGILCTFVNTELNSTQKHTCSPIHQKTNSHPLAFFETCLGFFCSLSCFLSLLLLQTLWGYRQWRCTRILQCEIFFLCWLLCWQEINHLLHFVWGTDEYGQHSSTIESLIKRIWFSTF